MAYHHTSEVRLGGNAEVNHTYYDIESGTVILGFQATTGSYKDESTYTFTSTNITVTSAQAYELLKALEQTLALMAVSQTRTDYLEREQLGLEGVSA